MATATLQPEQTVNSKYAIQQEQAVQEFPALQADNYRPTKKSDKISLALSESSFGLLTESQIAKLGEIKTEIMTYGTEDSTIFVLPSTLRWVFLNRPGTFVWDKVAKRAGYLNKGMKLAGSQMVTLSRCYLACVVNDEVLLNDAGEVQVFTLKLTSSKTGLIGGYNDKDLGVARNNGGKTLTALNAGLETHYGAKGWMTHLVSVNLVANPEVFPSSTSKDSSMGIRFALEGGAKPLTDASQELTFKLCSSEAFKAKVADPFGLTKGVTADRAIPAVGGDDIPF